MERNAGQKKTGPGSKLLLATCGGEDTAAKLNYERRELTGGKKGITKECSQR